MARPPIGEECGHSAKVSMKHGRPAHQQPHGPIDPCPHASHGRGGGRRGPGHDPLHPEGACRGVDGCGERPGGPGPAAADRWREGRWRGDTTCMGATLECGSEDPAHFNTMESEGVPEGTPGLAAAGGGRPAGSASWTAPAPASRTPWRGCWAGPGPPAGRGRGGPSDPEAPSHWHFAGVQKST